MKNNLQYFILTRFNLKKSDWQKDKNSQVVLDEKWLKDRIELFTKFCLPSVLGQTDKNFKWIVFFQQDPGLEIKSLLEILEEYEFIEPIFVNGFQEFQTQLSFYISERLGEDTQWILTSRLDNDDALNKNYVAEIKKASKNLKHQTIVYFPNGLFLDLGKKNRLAASHYPFNQFLNLLEEVQMGAIQTVLSRAHDSWGDFSVKELAHDDSWLQITHSSNMANIFRGVPVFSSRLKEFTIEKVHFSLMYDLKLVLLGGRRRLKNLIKR